ncbi:MAG TPA: NHL repeat-containing protein [Terracidiphilus sp.]|nr:NHL repeat-containing protein [Terracidiphilus sp.]
MANATSGKQPIVVSQVTWMDPLGAGGALAGSIASGTSFAVNPNGDIIVSTTYGGTVVFYNGQTGKVSTLGTFSNAGGVATDAQGNLYVGGQYSSFIVKVPYINGAYAALSDPTKTTPPNCAGNDTATCVVPAFAAISKGFADGSLAFDSQGDLFLGTNDQGTPHAIFECTAACMATGTPAPVMLFQEPTGSDPATTGQLYIGTMAIDPWGNLFFTDSNFINQSSNGNDSSYSDLYELTYTAGTGYAATPTLIYTFTVGTPGNYDDEIDGVAVDSNGTVYYATQYDGIFAFPNNSGVVDTVNAYALSTQGAKGLAIDGKGNFFVTSYHGSGDSVGRVTINNITTGASTIAKAATATATIMDNLGGCASSPSITVAGAIGGVATTEFTGAVGSKCSDNNGGSNFPLTVTFTPATVGERVAALTLTDATNSGSSIAAAAGVGQGALANLDPGVWTSFTTGFTAPSSVVSDAAGDVFVADSSAGKVYEIVAGTTTPVTVGSGFTSPTALAFDLAGDLFVADPDGPAIYKINNTGTTGAFVAGTQETAVSAATTFGGMTLMAPNGLAFGPDATLYIADLGLNAVVTYSLATKATGTTNATAANGLMRPVGVAVDSSGNLYVADDSANAVFVFGAAGDIGKIAPASAPSPIGVAVDPSGSLLIADKATGNIVRVPNLSGALDITKAIIVGTVPTAASGMTMDWAGDLYVADSANQAVYAIQRTAASLDLGTVPDGQSNSATVTLENAGNMVATLGDPAVSLPNNPMFTLTSSSTRGCVDAGTGPVGDYCEFTATFSPTQPASGPETGSFQLSTDAVDSPSTVTLMGNAGNVTTQTITGFTPPSTILIAQQITLSATGGASGNPVVFSIDASSACASCASISGTTLTATGMGTIIVDANQAAGTMGGINYSAAAPVQAAIAINGATPTGVPTYLMNQTSWLAPFPSGSGAFAGDNPAGTSFGINPKGQVVLSTSYGKGVILYDPVMATLTTMGSWGTQVGGITTDPAGNLYIGALYSPIVVKVPFVNGAYAALVDPTGSTAPANCTGSDTTECAVGVLSNLSTIGGFASFTFDVQGDLFVAADDKGTSPFSIWECTAACLATGTPAPVMLFEEPTGSSPSTTGQLYVGSIAIDPWGNLFFTDSNFISQTSSYGNESSYSDLYELPFTAGTGYATSPTVLQTLTIASPGSYDNEIDAVAAAPNGTIYYATQSNGVFGIPNTITGGADMAHQFVIAGQSAKEIAVDASGNILFVSYHGSGDSLGQILTSNNLTAPIAQLSGSPVTSSATVIDNAFGCGTAAALTFTSSNPEFSATASTSCSGIGASGLSTPISASSYAATISFSATKPGPQTATLTVTDATNGGEGTSTVTGIGQETPQAITFTAPASPVTFAPNVQITLVATGGGSNNPIVFTVDSTSTGAGTIAGNMLTVTGAGNLVIDANQTGGLVGGLFYSDAPQVQQTLVVGQAAQSITFTPPTTPVDFAAGLTVTLAATGGASGNPVVFSVDSSSTATGSISGDTLTVTSAGNLVIDANQAASTNYAAAAKVQQTIVVNPGTQTITFTPPPASVNFLTGLKITLTATGGASGNPVVFTVDAASAGAGTIAASVLTITGQGVIVIDANQAGNANYAAATQVQQSITVLPPLPTQTITFVNPGTQVVGTPLTLSATSSSGLAVTFSSATSSVCAVDGATATFVASGNCTINADQAGNGSFAAAPTASQTFIVNPTGQLPAVNLSLSLPQLTLSPTDVGLTALTIISTNSFTGSISFACSGLPSGYTCTFNPNPLTVAANQTALTNLSIKPGTSAAVHQDSKPLFPLATLAVALCFLGFKKRNRLQLLLLVAICAAGFGLISGCGGSSSSATKTKTTTSTVTVTATSGKVTQSTTLTLIIQ